jgi:hypothetical protein
MLKSIIARNNKYTFVENKKSNSIEIKPKEFEIPNNIIDIFLNIDKSYKNYDDVIKLNKNIEFDPLFLSTNFYDIFSEIENNIKFGLILNEERKNMLKKLKIFAESDKIYYWIIGSDGIGKTITLLYFSSLTNYKIVYFNLKLYVNALKENKNFHQYFYNDIQKFILKSTKTKKYNESTNYNFSQIIQNIESNINNNFDSNILLFWNNLYNFIKVNDGDDYIIIIDQYKSDKYDPNFKGLNKITKLIQDNNGNIKLILSSSMNNTSTKYDFVKNLDSIYNIKDERISIELISEIELNNTMNKEKIDLDYEEEEEVDVGDDEDSDNKSDCSFCQKIIIEEKNNLQKKEKKLDKEKTIINSECLLYQLSLNSQKDYYCSLVTEKEIYKKLLKEEEYIIAKNFNYNIKYIVKYLH